MRKPQTFFETSPDMTLIREMDNYYLYDPLRRSSELYEEDFKNHVAKMQVWHDLMLALYVIISMALLVFLYVPMIRRLG